MQKRVFENLSLEVPVLGLGCMRLPTLEDGEIDFEKGFEMVDYAIKNGIKYFDTAYMYHKYKSEVFLGEALSKYPRDSYFLATKLPLEMNVKTKEEMEQVFEEQLSKCRAEYFDFYLIHCLDKTKKGPMENLRVREFLEEKRRQGKIKYIGFSFHDSPEHFNYFVDKYNWDFVQVQINYLDWTLQQANEIYKTIEQKNLSCIVMEPVRGGALANLPDYAKEILDKRNIKGTPASLALRWVAQHRNIKVILSGMSDMDQLKENIGLFENYKEITRDENDALSEVAKALEASKAVMCTGCGYCVYACPVGVNIPYIFELYNRSVMFKDNAKAKIYYSFLKKNEKFTACRHCGNCLAQCPQNIPILEYLYTAHEEIKSE